MFPYPCFGLLKRLFVRPIQTPNSLDMFKPAPSARRQREKARRDPVKSHKPEVPALGAGSGGRLGSSLTAYIMKDLVQKDKISTHKLIIVVQF